MVVAPQIIPVALSLSLPCFGLKQGKIRGLVAGLLCMVRNIGRGLLVLRKQHIDPGSVSSWFNLIRKHETKCVASDWWREGQGGGEIK